MINLKERLLAARIEYHWWFVTHYRRRYRRLEAADRLIPRSPREQRLRAKASRHGSAAGILQDAYRKANFNPKA